jgi:hypothetical protein
VFFCRRGIAVPGLLRTGLTGCCRAASGRPTGGLLGSVEGHAGGVDAVAGVLRVSISPLNRCPRWESQRAQRTSGADHAVRTVLDVADGAGDRVIERRPAAVESNQNPSVRSLSSSSNDARSRSLL